MEDYRINYKLNYRTGLDWRALAASETVGYFLFVNSNTWKIRRQIIIELDLSILFKCRIRISLTFRSWVHLPLRRFRFT